MAKKFWKFRNSAESGAELILYGDIAQEQSWFGDEVTPKQFREDLEALGDVSDITVRINSGGGDVFAATAIGNALEACKSKVTAVIDGLCASAATIVACHCDKVIAASDSTYMIHPVKMGLCGYVGSVELETYVSAIKTIRDNIVSLYAKKTGRDKDEVAAQMDATSWFTAAEAKENGFIDELIDENAPVIENRNGMLFVNKVSMNMPFNEAPKFVQDSLMQVPAADGFANKQNPAAKPGNNLTKEEKEEMEIKTIDELRKAYPELTDQLENEAAETARNAERQRIHDIMDMQMPGTEAIANKAMFEDAVSAADFAKEAIKNMKAQGTAYLSNVENDAAASNVNTVPTVNAPTDEQGADEMLNAIRNVNKK